MKDNEISKIQYIPCPVVFFDGIHAWCSNIKFLHVVMEQIGIKRMHFQDKARHPHYDVWGRPAKKLLRITNTEVVSPKQLVRLIKKAEDGK